MPIAFTILEIIFQRARFQDALYGLWPHWITLWITHASYSIYEWQLNVKKKTELKCAWIVFSEYYLKRSYCVLSPLSAAQHFSQINSANAIFNRFYAQIMHQNWPSNNERYHFLWSYFNRKIKWPIIIVYHHLTKSTLFIWKQALRRTTNRSKFLN